jgi:hypothetical protein
LIGCYPAMRFYCRIARNIAQTGYARLSIPCPQLLTRA